MEMRSNENGFSQPENLTRPLASVLAVTAGLFRLLPHLWNFTPVNALGLFCGARLRSWHAFVLPLAVRAVTDAILLPIQGAVADPLFYLSFLPFVYASLLVNVLLGRILCRTESPWRIGAVTVLASVQFFLVTNFGAWIGSDMYPHTLEGLGLCYLAGLLFYGPDAAYPLGFFGNTLLGDLSFAALLFGVQALLSRTAFPTERVYATIRAR
jgi:hypothetical protein